MEKVKARRSFNFSQYVLLVFTVIVAVVFTVL